MLSSSLNMPVPRHKEMIRLKDIRQIAFIIRRVVLLPLLLLFGQKFGFFLSVKQMKSSAIFFQRYQNSCAKTFLSRRLLGWQGFLMTARTTDAILGDKAITKKNFPGDLSQYKTENYFEWIISGADRDRQYTLL